LDDGVVVRLSVPIALIGWDDGWEARSRFGLAYYYLRGRFYGWG
jgi:hypothetical protein